MAIEELFDGQLSFADIDAEKFLQVRRAHADRRVNAMDRLTDDVINELIQLCLPHYHIKAGETVQQGRPYTRLEEALQKPLFPSRIEQNRSVRFFFTTSKNGVFLPSK